MPLDAALDALAGRRVLVVGATGFIGSRLAETLAGAPGAEVTALVRNSRRAAPLARLGVRLRRADLAGDLSQALASQDVVFNLAYDVRQTAAPNLARFRALAKAAQTACVSRFVHVSSIAVYDSWPGDADLTEASPSGGGASPYKIAKSTMEAELAGLARAGSLASAVIQPTNVYGPRSLLWTDLPVEKLLAGGMVLPEDGADTCNAVYVDDVVQALILAAVAPGAVGERFIISGSEPVRWRDLFGGYAQALGRPEALILKPAASLVREPGPQPGGVMTLPAVHAVLGAVRAAVGEAGLARLRALARRGQRQVSYPGAGDLALFLAQGVCRIDKARARLGYTPAFDLARGLEATAPYIRAKG